MGSGLGATDTDTDTDTYTDTDTRAPFEQKLLKVVRQLSADMDREAEVRKEELRAEYGSRIEEALREVQEIRSERDVLEAKNTSLAEQRDMYRILLAQADRSYVQDDDVMPDVRASTGGAASSSSEMVVSPSAAAARARNNTAEAVRKIQQEMNDKLEESDRVLAQQREELSAMREEKTKSTLACAQAQSDNSFLKEKLASLRATDEAMSKEVNDLRSRCSMLQGQLGAAESKLSELVKEAVSAKQSEQQARERLIAAESGNKHSEARIAQVPLAAPLLPALPPASALVACPKALHLM